MSLHAVTWFRHWVTQPVSDGAHKVSKGEPLNSGQSAATRALAAVQVVRATGAQPMNLPPPQMHAPDELHWGNGQ